MLLVLSLRGHTENTVFCMSICAVCVLSINNYSKLKINAFWPFTSLIWLFYGILFKIIGRYYEYLLVKFLWGKTEMDMSELLSFHNTAAFKSKQNIASILKIMTKADCIYRRSIF